MNWTNLWLKLFGTTTWMGLDIGFWVSMGISVLVALLMIVVFCSQKPCNETKAHERKNHPEHPTPLTQKPHDGSEG